MNTVYFEEHIREELDGACDYIKKAIELKAMDLNMSKIFAVFDIFGESYGRNILPG